MISFGANLTTITLRWTDLKSLSGKKSLVLQYDEDDAAYRIFSVEGPIVYTGDIWKVEVPWSIIQSGYTQEQNDNDKSDWETNYKASANKPITTAISAPISDTGSPVVATMKAINPKLTFFSPNWCDKTTWWEGSVAVTNESATDSGDHTTYSLAHQFIIDTYHGKLTFEDFLKDSLDGSFRVVVKVNGDTKTEQDPHYGSGGDYTINYAAGTISFLSALQSGDAVTVSYHYAASSILTVKPIPGKMLILDKVEVSVSDDIVMNDTAIFQAYGLVDVFAPQLMPGIPSGTKIPLGDPLVYKTIDDLNTDSNLSYPAYPALGGSGWRGMKRPRYTFSWDYDVGATVLHSIYGMEIRITLQHDTPASGDHAILTFYCTSSSYM